MAVIYKKLAIVKLKRLNALTLQYMVYYATHTTLYMMFCLFLFPKNVNVFEMPRNFKNEQKRSFRLLFRM